MTTQIRRFDPDLRIIFKPGKYDEAVQNYLIARKWLLTTGIAEREGLYGFLFAPKHPKVPVSSRYTPIKVTNEKSWMVKIEIQVDDDDTLAWIGELKLPEGSFAEMTQDSLL